MRPASRKAPATPLPAAIASTLLSAGPLTATAATNARTAAAPLTTHNEERDSRPKWLRQWMLKPTKAQRLPNKIGATTRKRPAPRAGPLSGVPSGFTKPPRIERRATKTRGEQVTTAPTKE